jgi:hypothetical protein
MCLAPASADPSAAIGSGASCLSAITRTGRPAAVSRRAASRAGPTLEPGQNSGLAGTPRLAPQFTGIELLELLRPFANLRHMGAGTTHRDSETCRRDWPPAACP